MAKLVVFRNRDREAAFELRGSKVVVGRARSCHLQLDDRLISREHALFTKDDDGWHVADMGTSNGIFLNEERVTSASLSPGDLVTLGQHVLVFREGEMTETEDSIAAVHLRGWRGPGSEPTHRLPSVRAAQLQTRARLRLEAHVVLLGDENEARALGDGPLVVGWGDECDLALPGRGWLVGKAAEFTRDARGYWYVSALHKRAKVQVNGEPVEQRRLEDGDVVAIKGHTVRFHTAATQELRP